MVNFPKNLKQLRTEKQMSQEELGSVLNLSKSTISLYESGKRTPDFETLKQIAQFFNCSTDYLLSNTEGQPTPEEKIKSALMGDDELVEFWQELTMRDDLQLLFKQVRPLSPESIRKIIRIIKAIEDEEAEK